MFRHAIGPALFAPPPHTYSQSSENGLLYPLLPPCPHDYITESLTFHNP